MEGGIVGPVFFILFFFSRVESSVFVVFQVKPLFCICGSVLCHMGRLCGLVPSLPLGFIPPPTQSVPDFPPLWIWDFPHGGLGPSLRLDSGLMVF